MSKFQPPPTWAMPVSVNKDTKEGFFNPVWLKWFIDLSKNLDTSGATSATVTNVAALTLGTSGTGLSSTVANSTTTPVITLQVPTASAANRGALAAADWSIFNAKQPALTPAALTKTDDTNVTMTLGGTPTTALLQAVSMALGWTGQLATSRGGTGVDNSTGGTANQFWARPDGATGAATYRAVVAADIPALNYAPNVTYVTPTTLNDGSLNAAVAGFGCNSKAAQTVVTVDAASIDLVTVVALCNQLRLALIANGIVI